MLVVVIRTLPMPEAVFHATLDAHG